MRSLLSILGLCAVVFAASPVAADDMDITLARLRLAPTGDCPAVGENGLPRAFCADNDEWERLMSELGGSLVPQSLSPARTLGYGGFFVGIDTWITGIDGGARHWRVGTEGDEGAGMEDCVDGTGLGCNRFPDDVLIWSRVNVRKGFPFGFELGTSFAYLWNTELFAWGLEIRWALFEGYRRGFWAFLPDVAVRGMVNTLVGDNEFNVTVPSVDVIVSKPITIAGSAVISPFVSGQLAWIFADSELIDLTPNIDAYDECRPATMGDMSSCQRTEPIPGGRSPGEDYNNNATFDQVRTSRFRLTFGVHGRYEAITLAASFSFDLVKPGDDEDLPDDVNRQWVTTFGAGATF